MSLAQNYAAIIEEGMPTEKVVAHMKTKGHLSLLPRILRILERAKTAEETITVAREADTAKISKKFPNARVVIDPKIVGGWFAKKGTAVTDATYRKALVSIYKNALGN